VRGADAHGKVALKKTLSHGKLLEFFANLPPAIVGMEACSGAHHWARALRSLGHDARIIAPRFVNVELTGGALAPSSDRRERG